LAKRQKREVPHRQGDEESERSFSQREHCGETTAWRMIKKVIRLSERFIYLEDQYLTDFGGAAV
jgi:hypothetical protein